uniref:Uncharacterized protein n=1 Tax=Timema bartmani TaxID=61472 RepID=A0A7R9I990_9NEOP|nr:unnamed protein product [Timema bartmani]
MTSPVGAGVGNEPIQPVSLLEHLDQFCALVFGQSYEVAAMPEMWVSSGAPDQFAPMDSSMFTQM